MREYNDYEIPSELASRDAQLNPYPQFTRLRNQEPVRYDERRDVWDVFRYEDVNEVLVNPDQYRSEGTSHFGKHLLASDPPEHTNLREMIKKFFNSGYISDLEPLIERRAEQFLTDAADGGRMDFLRDVAIPYPVSIIADLLDIPQQHRQQYREWSENLLRAPPATDAERIQESHDLRAQTRQEMNEFFDDIVSDREQNLGEDIISTLIRVRDSTDFFTHDILLNTCNILMVGGHITTSAFLSNAMLEFIRHGVLFDLDDETSRSSALEEALRYRSPVARFDRLTSEPVTLGGKRIPADERVILWAASANRDERVFDAPDEFRPDRNINRPHIAFGQGIHTCIGNNLARVEGRILFNTFLEQFDDAALATESLEPFPSTMVNGVDTLPLTVEQ